MFQKHVKFDSPTSYFVAEGGSLGYSMPASLGIKLAAGNTRTVVNVVGDGSTLFYPHTWWTAAKFKVPILYIVVNNHRYQTLIGGLEYVKTSYHWEPSGQADYLRLTPPPELSFVGIAAAFGVQGALVTKVPDLEPALVTAINVVQGKQPEPYVLEVLTEPTPPAKKIPRLDPLFARKEGSDDDPVFWDLGPA